MAISSYENQVVPGLLQTEAYARAVFENKLPPLAPYEADVQVAGRLERQGILRRTVPPSSYAAR
ncbi:hypothetical protein GCM10009863_18160 [Streptomyces axinellae]|uniref:DUF5753 domain-containing protein n=1 Tax=Streptomyces axinellae TaxID=552788 RepID=A0ABN3Q0C7_9ACTN